MIQKRNRFSTNSQKSKKITLDFQPLANPKIENMKRRFMQTFWNTVVLQTFK